MTTTEPQRSTRPQIQFLAFDDCPLADAARVVLESALAHCGLPRDGYETIDIMSDSAPADLAGWGSPTILINGLDAAGASKGDGIGCRVYPTADRVPAVETIVAAIKAGSRER